MARTRIRHAAVLVPPADATGHERVLLIAGLGTGGRSLEWLDPRHGTGREVAARLAQFTNDIAAVRLGNGRILIVGGQCNFNLQTLSDSYIFDPADESLRPVEPPPLREAGISDHEVIAIGHQAFIFGGEQQRGRVDTELDYVAVFDGDCECWVFAGRMTQARDDFAAARLADGRILLIDGAVSLVGNEAPTATAEIFTPREIIAGDANGDGRANRLDVSRFVDLLLRPDDPDWLGRSACDMNRDFAIDARDIDTFAATIVGCE